MGFGEVAAPAELADAQLESPDASVPEAVAVAVAGRLRNASQRFDSADRSRPICFASSLGPTLPPGWKPDRPEVQQVCCRYQACGRHRNRVYPGKTACPLGTAPQRTNQTLQR